MTLCNTDHSKERRSQIHRCDLGNRKGEHKVKHYDSCRMIVDVNLASAGESEYEQRFQYYRGPGREGTRWKQRSDARKRKVSMSLFIVCVMFSRWL